MSYDGEEVSVCVCCSQAHTNCISAVFLLVVIAVILIFIEADGWSVVSNFCFFETTMCFRMAKYTTPNWNKGRDVAQ